MLPSTMCFRFHSGLVGNEAGATKRVTAESAEVAMQLSRAVNEHPNGRRRGLAVEPRR